MNFKILKTSSVLQGAYLTIFGTVISGLVGFVVVQNTHPQPPWGSPLVFIQNFHWIQTAPYFFGTFLLLGTMLLTCGLVDRMPLPYQAQSRFAVALVVASCTLIFLNYIVQVSFLPHLSVDDSVVISALTMSHPASLAWSIEMWSYGLMGLGLWLMVPAFEGSRLIRWLLRLNATVGVFGAAATAMIKGWPMSTSGMISFFLWNVIYIVLMMAIAKDEGLKRQQGRS